MELVEGWNLQYDSTEYQTNHLMYNVLWVVFSFTLRSFVPLQRWGECQCVNVGKLKYTELNKNKAFFSLTLTFKIFILHLFTLYVNFFGQHIISRLPSM